MNKRLQQFLNAENVSQSQFADAIGVTKASVSHIIAGRNKPGFEFIESIARIYPALNLEWLITGKGRMYKSPASDEDIPETLPLQEQVSEIQEVTSEEPHIVRVVVFYSDGTFKEI